MDQCPQTELGTTAQAARDAADPKLLADALYDFGFAASPETGEQLARYQQGRPWFEEAWRNSVTRPVSMHASLDRRETASRSASPYHSFYRAC